MSVVPDCLIVCNSTVSLVKAMRRVGGRPREFLDSARSRGWARRMDRPPFVLRLEDDANDWGWQDSHDKDNAVEWMSRTFTRLPVVTYEEVFGYEETA